MELIRTPLRTATALAVNLPRYARGRGRVERFPPLTLGLGPGLFDAPDDLLAVDDMGARWGRLPGGNRRPAGADPALKAAVASRRCGGSDSIKGSLA